MAYSLSLSSNHFLPLFSPITPFSLLKPLPTCNSGSTWVTLWLVTLANHNVTCGFLLFLSQDFFVVLYTSNIVVGNVTNVTNHSVTQVLSLQLSPSHKALTQIPLSFCISLTTFSLCNSDLSSTSNHAATLRLSLPYLLSHSKSSDLNEKY